MEKKGECDSLKHLNEVMIKVTVTERQKLRPFEHLTRVKGHSKLNRFNLITVVLQTKYKFSVKDSFFRVIQKPET